MTFKYSGLLLALAFIAACSSQPGQGNEQIEAGEVNVFSHRFYDSDKELFKRFEAETGITVNVKEEKDDNQIAILQSEGENAEADIIITVDAGRLHFAKELGLLQTIESEVLMNNIPSHLRDVDNQWFGLTKRARVIIYNKETVDPQELSTYEDLTNEKWKGQIFIRSSANIYNQSLLSSIISRSGEEAALDWATGLVANMARVPKGNDRDQIKEVAAGNGKIAIANTYYLGKLLTSDNEMESNAAKAVAVFFPNQNTSGTHINISGAGVVKYSKNKENAIKFLEFLSGVEAQKHFGEANFEYPVHPEVEPSELLKSWGEFVEDKINLNELGVNNVKAVSTFETAGWK